MPCIIFCTLLTFSRHIRSCRHYNEFNWVKIFRFLSSMLLLDIIEILKLPKMCWIFTPFFSIKLCYTIKRYSKDTCDWNASHKGENPKTQEISQWGP